MKIAHLSDLHITEGPRLADQEAVLGFILSNLTKQRPALVVITGDIYGRTVPHRSTPAERAAFFPFVRALTDLAPVVVLYGNHDYEGDLEPLETVGRRHPVRVVSRAERFIVHTAVGPAWLYALPYPTKRWILAGGDAPRGLAEQQAEVERRLGDLLQTWGQAIRAKRAGVLTGDPEEGAIVTPHILLAHLQVGGSLTSGGEVLAGQEIELSAAQLGELPIDYGALGHLHLRQSPAHRCYYAGSPWRNDFGETDAKGYQLVTLGADIGPDGRLPLTVEHVVTPCRSFLTLNYRWAADSEDGAPRWVTRPPEAKIAKAAGAEVRMRLTVPEQWVAGCPWVEEQARVSTAGAHRIKLERVIEPTLRVRAPRVAAAVSLGDKLGAYWGTLATPPDPAEQAAALAALEELQTRDDGQIAADTRALVG
jgi:exonuclease SbcD